MGVGSVWTSVLLGQSTRSIFRSILSVSLILSFAVVAFENSSRYGEAAALTGRRACSAFGICSKSSREARRFRLANSLQLVIRSIAAIAFQATYTWARAVAFPSVRGLALFVVALLVGRYRRDRQCERVSAESNTGSWVSPCSSCHELIPVHSFVEASVATDQGSPSTVIPASVTALPRSRPSFAAWSNLSMLASVFVVLHLARNVCYLRSIRFSEVPVLFVVVGVLLTLFIAVPITLAAVISHHPFILFAILPRHRACCCR